MKKNKFNIAIVGLGNIGFIFYKHLIKNKIILKKTGVNFDIKYVSAKKTQKRKLKIPKNKWLKNHFDASKIERY